MNNNYPTPIINFASDTTIAKLQADIASQAINAKQAMHFTESREKLEEKEIKSGMLQDLYLFALAVIFLFLLFFFLKSESFMELAKEQRNSKVTQLKAKKALIEKELAEMGEK